MKPVATSLVEGDILENKRTGEIVRVIRTAWSDSWYSSGMSYLLEVLKIGSDWTNMKVEDQFWADDKDVHWVYTKLPKTHPAYILFGKE